VFHPCQPNNKPELPHAGEPGCLLLPLEEPRSFPSSLTVSLVFLSEFHAKHIRNLMKKWFKKIIL
jgi:hypothetical protein